MKNKLEIAVCGCGPAGLAAALLLARAGHRVRIFDQFDAPRPVGSGLILQPTGLAVLAELGLLEPIRRLGARIERLYGRVFPSRRVVLDVRYHALGQQHFAIAVHRAALFDTLYEAVCREQVEIVTGQRITGVVRAHKATLVTRAAADIGPFDLVVDALGANSALASDLCRRTVLPYGALWTTVRLPENSVFQANALEQRYRRAYEMAGVLPIGRRTPEGEREATFFWSIKRSAFEGWRAAGLDAWRAQVHALWPEAAELIADVHTAEAVVLAQYDHFTAKHPWSERLVHIGDAAHATSPQLGQGANMALLDAFALSRALAAHEDVFEALPGYARMRRWHVRLFQWASAMFTPFYQSDGRVLPFIRDRIAAPASRLPIADALTARLVSGMTIAPLAGARTSLDFARVHQEEAMRVQAVR